MGRFVVGRQPIFDNGLDVHGYELLFRNQSSTQIEPDAMTAEVLVHAGLDLGLENLVGNKLAFVNASRSFIVGDLPVSLPAEQTVIEILEDVGRDDEVLEGCRRLTEQGYLLALDDFVFLEGDAPFIDLASIVKLDLQALDQSQVERHVEQSAAFDVRLLAEKVETHQQLEFCRNLGFDLYQGYLLSRPHIVPGKSLAPNHLTCLRLIEKLSDPDVEARELATIVETDAGLSYRFLRAAALGPVGGFQRKLNSVREGIVLLGTRRLRDWVALMLLADTHEGSAEQLTIAMTRARMSELLAEAIDHEMPEAAFTVGLLSAFDLLLEAPLPEIVANLTIADELVEGLLNHSGEIGAILRDVLAWELGGDGLQWRLEQDLAVMEQSYLQALSWATDLCKTLEAAA